MVAHDLPRYSGIACCWVIILGSILSLVGWLSWKILDWQCLLCQKEKSAKHPLVPTHKLFKDWDCIYTERKSYLIQAETKSVTMWSSESAFNFHGLISLLCGQVVKTHTAILPVWIEGLKMCHPGVQFNLCTNFQRSYFFPSDARL